MRVRVLLSAGLFQGLLPSQLPCAKRNASGSVRRFCFCRDYMHLVMVNGDVSIPSGTHSTTSTATTILHGVPVSNGEKEAGERSLVNIKQMVQPSVPSAICHRMSDRMCPIVQMNETTRIIRCYAWVLGTLQRCCYLNSIRAELCASVYIIVSSSPLSANWNSICVQPLLCILH
jgi:hypothetical protein